MRTYVKKYFLSGTLLLCFLALGACEDFLKEEPKSSFTADQYFAKPEHARASVNALYRKGFTELYNADGAYAGPNIMLGGYISGFFDNEYKGQEQYVRKCQQLDITPLNEVGGRMGNVWDPCFEAINRANTAIKNVPLTPGLTENEATYLLAQARFFRALNYFHLVKFFGDLPLLTEPCESLEDPLYVERSSSDKVYALIEADLKIAAAGLKDELFTKEFRVTKHTAYALLANLYLQWSGFPLQAAGHYADAAVAAREVINSGKHQLVENGNTPEESAYNSLRTKDDISEIIYAKEFNLNISDGGWWPSYSATGQAEGKKISGTDEKMFKWDIMKNVYGLTKAFYDVYDPADLRVAEKQFFYTSYGDYAYDFTDLDPVLAPLCNWFFFEQDAMVQSNKPQKDKPVIRYAEVLLIAAEAIAQAEGVTPEAVGYLAAVRSRAGLSTDGLAALSKDAFIREVWAERLREFPLEFKVWDDIQRTRMYPQTDPANRGLITWVNVVGAKNPWGATFEEKHLLWPISANEIQRNPSLTQNSGY
jgi:hypothetical protein